MDGNKKNVKPIRREKTKKRKKKGNFKEKKRKWKIMKEMKYEKLFKFNTVFWLLLACAIVPLLVNILYRFPSKTSVPFFEICT